MSSIPTILTDLKVYPDAEALVQSRATVDAMRANAYFLHPDIPYVDADTANDEFDDALTDHVQGDSHKTAVKNAKRAVMDKNYSTQGHYVIRICDGNVEMLRSSKYEMAKEREHHQIPDFDVKHGENPGEVKFIIKAVSGASSYLIQFRIVSEPTPNAWDFCKVLGSHEGTFDGLVSGKQYEFRMKVIYSKTEGAYGNPFPIRAL